MLDTVPAHAPVPLLISAGPIGPVGALPPPSCLLSINAASWLAHLRASACPPSFACSPPAAAAVCSFLLRPSWPVAFLPLVAAPPYEINPIHSYTPLSVSPTNACTPDSSPPTSLQPRPRGSSPRPRSPPALAFRRPASGDPALVLACPVGWPCCQCSRTWHTPPCCSWLLATLGLNCVLLPCLLLAPPAACFPGPAGLRASVSSTLCCFSLLEVPAFCLCT